MKITVVGGGNIGTQFAVHCAEKGHEVTVFTSTPEVFDREISIVDEIGAVTHKGRIRLATSDPEKAFPTAELILVTVPATAMRDIAGTIFEHTFRQTMIGVVPGNGGSECAFGKCIERGNTFWGMERVPAIARLVKKGKSVRSTGYRDELHVSAIPANRGDECAKLVGDIFDMKTICIPNYLNLTMTPSNPILHTSRLRVILKDWHEGVVLDRLPLFYEDWDDESSELLIACDNEVQEICGALSGFDLKYVRSLKDHYGCSTVETMTKKIASIPAFKGLATPATAVEGGFIPDLHSRYFTADFSYGLNIIKQIGDFAGVSTPNINEILAWYKEIAVETQEFRYSDYGILTYEDFVSFYLK